jgi:hypothetical protein
MPKLERQLGKDRGIGSLPVVQLPLATTEGQANDRPNRTPGGLVGHLEFLRLAVWRRYAKHFG